MGAPAETPLSNDVAPGETIDINLIMQAPFEEKNYTGNWMMRDATGGLFGIGETADQPIKISIIVKDPPLSHNPMQYMDFGCA